MTLRFLLLSAMLITATVSAADAKSGGGPRPEGRDVSEASLGSGR